jgi:Ca2+-transporting ATPase
MNRSTGESEHVKKIPGSKAMARLSSKDKCDQSKLDPFIISGSKVSEGIGTYLATGVGVHSSHGELMLALKDEAPPTPLQVKMLLLAQQIAKLGGTVAMLLFVVLFIRFLVQLRGSTNTPSEKAQNFLQILIISVTVLVIAVPEGLPLAVTLTQAFAFTKMLKGNNLVRILRACEVMGNATVVCSDKTGTLTTKKMIVVTGIVGSDFIFRECSTFHQGQPYDEAVLGPLTGDVPDARLALLSGSGEKTTVAIHSDQLHRF